MLKNGCQSDSFALYFSCSLKCVKFHRNFVCNAKNKVIRIGVARYRCIASFCDKYIVTKNEESYNISIKE